ncbi:MAG: V-type ATPase subunit [Eubacteriales bacterium]|nr:V-type ATPase subunit [Eubacteriales bacterium]
MTENMHIYAVARIRSRELDLLGESVINQLVDCNKFEECMKILFDKGWGKSGFEEADELLAAESDKTWDLIGEIVEDMSIFDTLLLENDYHNLKAAIKQAYMNRDIEKIYFSRGTVKREIIFNAVKEHNFSVLDEKMGKCAEEAYQVLFHTGDGQLCDVIIDKSAMEAIYEKAAESGNEVLIDYAELKVASADIKIALRCSRTGKSREFTERAIAECATLDIKSLIDSSAAGENELFEYLLSTPYAEVINEIKKSPAAFEIWFDNLLIKHIKPQKYNSFTMSPLAAYILARENEIKTVRIILLGKLNRLSDSSIRERLRNMYV